MTIETNELYKPDYKTQTIFIHSPRLIPLKKKKKIRLYTLARVYIIIIMLLNARRLEFDVEQ